MANSVIVLKTAVAAPVNNTLLELTLRATDVTPEDIILYPRPLEAVADLVTVTLVEMGITNTWPTVNQVTGGVEWYQDGFKYTGAISAGSAIYPSVGDVDSGVLYGPSGIDYSGTLVQPVVSDVKSGVTYGAGGTEFTGTLVPGSSGSSIHIDVDTGNLYKDISPLLILKL